MKKTKMITVDEGAHAILMGVKEQIRKEGTIGRPSHSDAIRFLKIRKNWRQKK